MKNPYKIYLSSATCMNLVKLDAALKSIVIPEGMKANYMLILAGKIVDHTTMEYLQISRIELSKPDIPVCSSEWSTSVGSRTMRWPIA